MRQRTEMKRKSPMTRTKKVNWKWIMLSLPLASALHATAEEGVREAALAAPHPLYRADVPMRIDGVLDEAAWRTAEPVPFYVPVSLKKPTTATDARMTWDDTYLYVGFDVQDEDIVATFTERDAPVWEEDVVEVFIRPDPERSDYYEINFSPTGVIYDSWIVRRGARSHRTWSAWNAEGIRVATTIRGTPNDWTQRDEGYTVEIAIPFSELPSLEGRTPSVGDVWTFNLARYDYSVYLDEGRELSASSPLSAVSFHRHEEWRRMIFKEAP